MADQENPNQDPQDSQDLSTSPSTTGEHGEEPDGRSQTLGRVPEPMQVHEMQEVDQQVEVTAGTPSNVSTETAQMESVSRETVQMESEPVASVCQVHASSCRMPQGPQVTVSDEQGDTQMIDKAKPSGRKESQSDQMCVDDTANQPVVETNPSLPQDQPANMQVHEMQEVDQQGEVTAGTPSNVSTETAQMESVSRETVQMESEPVASVCQVHASSCRMPLGPQVTVSDEQGDTQMIDKAKPSGRKESQSDQMCVDDTANQPVVETNPSLPQDQPANPFYGNSASLPAQKPPALGTLQERGNAASMPVIQCNKAAASCPPQVSRGDTKYKPPLQDPALGADLSRIAPMMSHQPSSSNSDDSAPELEPEACACVSPMVGQENIHGQINGSPAGSLHTDNAWAVHAEQDMTLRRSTSPQANYVQNAGGPIISLRENSRVTGLGGPVGTLHTDNAWHPPGPTQPIHESNRRPGHDIARPMQAQAGMVNGVVCTDDVRKQSVTGTKTQEELLRPYFQDTNMAVEDPPSSTDSTQAVHACTTASSQGAPKVQETPSLGLISSTYEGAVPGKVKRGRAAQLSKKMQTLETSLHQLQGEKKDLLAVQKQQEKELEKHKNKIEQTEKHSMMILTKFEEQQNENRLLRKECDIFKKKDEERDKEMEQLRRKSEKQSQEFEKQSQELQNMKEKMAKFEAFMECQSSGKK